MVAIKGRKSSNKNPPILSHEFVIQNHADIVSCVAMVFVVGLMMQVTSPWAYMFIALQHNVTEPIYPTEDTPYVPPKYGPGWKDSCAIFFYFLITIVMHAVLQEYIFDKISKRLHLSKSKMSKFNDSCQMVVFYVLSALWGIDIIIRDSLFLNIPAFWQEYPVPMSFSLKLYFISQIAYWLHTYPELYFQRTKKEEMPPRIYRAAAGLVLTIAAYVLNFQHVTLVLLTLHFIAQALQHGAKLIHFANYKEAITRVAFLIGNSVFSLVRVASAAIAAVFFFYGLGQVERSQDLSSGNFNIPLVQYSALAVVLFFQAYLMVVFIKKQRKYAHENEVPVTTKVTKSKQKPKKKDVKKAASEDDELPEVDQATRKNLRSRSSAKTK